MRRWMLWIPDLMVASLFYWTLTLGLGGLSLMALTELSGGHYMEVIPTPACGAEMQVDDSILVNLEPQVEEQVEEIDDQVDDEADEADGVSACTAGDSAGRTSF